MVRSVEARGATGMWEGMRIRLIGSWKKSSQDAYGGVGGEIKMYNYIRA